MRPPKAAQGRLVYDEKRSSLRRGQDFRALLVILVRGDLIRPVLAQQLIQALVFLSRDGRWRSLHFLVRTGRQRLGLGSLFWFLGLGCNFLRLGDRRIGARGFGGLGHRRLFQSRFGWLWRRSSGDRLRLRLRSCRDCRPGWSLCRRNGDRFGRFLRLSCFEFLAHGLARTSNRVRAGRGGSDHRRLGFGFTSGCRLSFGRRRSGL